VILCVGWQADAVEAALGASHGPLRLRYSCEAEPLGTAGALRLALPLLAGPAVMVLNGDSFCDADLAAVWAWHRAQRSTATLVLVEMADTSRYGRVEVAPSGAICRFVEKQDGGTRLDQCGNLSTRPQPHRVDRARPRALARARRAAGLGRDGPDGPPRPGPLH
jgi:NDP-sugar pyrophosphorylase family protein